MPKKRKLDPQSVWDGGALEQAFEEANIKKVHVTKLYKCVPTASYILGCRLDRDCHNAAFLLSNTTHATACCDGLQLLARKP
jgi:hypothetical protein